MSENDTTPAKLEVKNASVSYQSLQGKATIGAIQSVNLRVREGQFVALVGPSGCGKSTLLNAIAGLQPLDSGEIFIDGKKTDRPSPDRAMVFQNPSLMPWRTVMRNVAYGLEIKGMGKTDASNAALKYIELVGLKGFESSYPHELSGGMQQRVNVARALAVEPSLLLLDEPFSALDALTRQYMQLEIQRIWQQTKTTAVYITHQISEAIFLADQVVVMSARPGHIKAVVDVPLPYPRHVVMKRSAAFNELEKQVWALIKEEVAKMGIDLFKES